MTINSLVGKIKKEYDAVVAGADKQCKRLVDAALLLALCIKQRLQDKCELVIFSSSNDSSPGYFVLRNLGTKILANLRRCHAAISQLGRGTQLPMSYLQELSAARVKIDHLVLFTDGLIAPARNPQDGLSRWLSSYRDRIHPVRFACVDVLGLGDPNVEEGEDVLISGYSESVLRYLAQEPGAQLAEVEAVELPSPPLEAV